MALALTMVVACEQADRRGERSHSAAGGSEREGIQVGKEYPFALPVHCGVLGAHFGGREWNANPPLSDGSGNPPQGWDENTEHGTMTLLAADRAVFRSSSGDRTANFALRPSGSPDPNAGCE